MKLRNRDVIKRPNRTFEYYMLYSLWSPRKIVKRAIVSPRWTPGGPKELQYLRRKVYKLKEVIQDYKHFVETLIHDELRDLERRERITQQQQPQEPQDATQQVITQQDLLTPKLEVIEPPAGPSGNY